MNPRRKREWFDDDAFWTELYSFLFSEKHFAEAEKQVQMMLKLTAPRGRVVLDLCCGPGRFSIPLARMGFAVTGVDRTRFLLDKARARARSAKVRVEWVEQDMRDFLRPDAYDLVLSTFTSFGYFDNKQEDIGVLRNMFTNLKTGGKCLIELLGKEYLARVYQPTISEVLPDGAILVERHEVFDDWTRVRNEWILIREGKSKTFKFHHTIYSGQELRDRMEGVGFRNVKLCGSLDGTGYDREAQRLIAVGTKQ